MFMAEENFEKLLSADVDSKLADRFLEQADQRGYKKKRSLAAAVKLWVELPEVVQARLLNQSLDGDSLVELVQQILDEYIEEGRKAGLKLVERQRKKRTQKG